MLVGFQKFQIIMRQGLNFFLFFYIAKTVTPYEFGAYNYVVAFITLILVFSDFGLSVAITKFIAEDDDDSKHVSLFFSSAIILLILAIVVSIIYIFLGSKFNLSFYNETIFLLPVLFFLPLSSIYDGYARGLQQFKK